MDGYYTYQHDRRGEQVNVEYHEGGDCPHIRRIDHDSERIFIRRIIKGIQTKMRRRRDRGYRASGTKIS